MKIDEKTFKLLALVGSPNDHEADTAFSILRKNISKNPSQWMDIVTTLTVKHGSGGANHMCATYDGPVNWRTPSEEELVEEQAYREALHQSIKRKNIDEKVLFKCTYKNDEWLTDDDPIIIKRRRDEEERQQQEELRKKQCETAEQPTPQTSEKVSKAEEKRREKEAQSRQKKIENAKKRGKSKGLREAREYAQDLEALPLLQKAIYVFQNRFKLSATDREAIEGLYSRTVNNRYAKPTEARVFRKIISENDATLIERLKTLIERKETA